MKKLTILGFCAAATFAVSAQTTLVKDVERQMKASAENYPANLEKLKPAFSDPETANDAYPYFVAGKGGADYFDQLEGYKAIGRSVDSKSMGHALINSYDYLKSALQKDSVADAKGKIKTKYSKDIFKIINSHYADYDKAARYLWDVQDYKGAYDAWEIFLTAPTEPLFGANAPKSLADTAMSELYYNQALAAWQATELQKAIESFDKALTRGYNKQQLFDYAISVAYNMNDAELAAHYAELAHELYGEHDTKYIGYIINAKIKHEKYAEAEELINKYIAEDPANGNNYFVLGVIYDNQNMKDKARPAFEKAVELDHNHIKALNALAKYMWDEASQLDDKNAELPTEEYNRLRLEQVNPILQKSAEYFERAYSLDPEGEGYEALRNLRTIYYNLQDETNLKRIEAELSK